MLQHGDWAEDRYEYKLQTIIDNVSLIPAALWRAVNRVIVDKGHEVAGLDPADPIQARADSFVVETNVGTPAQFNKSWRFRGLWAHLCLVWHYSEQWFGAYFRSS